MPVAAQSAVLRKPAANENAVSSPCLKPTSRNCKVPSMTGDMKAALYACGILGATALALKYKQKSIEEQVAKIIADAKKDLEPLGTRTV